MADKWLRDGSLVYTLINQDGLDFNKFAINVQSSNSVYTREQREELAEKIRHLPELVEALEAAENELDWAYSNAQPMRNSRAQADKEAVELENVLCKVRTVLAKVKGDKG